jgi:hypothetical protein
MEFRFCTGRAGNIISALRAMAFGESIFEQKNDMCALPDATWRMILVLQLRYLAAASFHFAPGMK